MNETIIFHRPARFGFILLAISLIIVLGSSVVVNQVQQNCINNSGSCDVWRSALFGLGVVVSVTNIVAIINIRTIPSESIPPEKLIGIFLGLLGVFLGILMSISSVSLLFIG